MVEAAGIPGYGTTFLPTETLTPEPSDKLQETLHFQDEWLYKFDKKNTRQEIFYVNNNEKINVSMMTYKRTNQFRETVAFPTFVTNLMKHAKYETVELKIPKFKFSPVTDMVPTLQKVDARKIFPKAPNYGQTSKDSTNTIRMNNIMSSTYYVKVDEDGTDALLPEIENAGTKSDIHSTLSAFYENIITDNKGPVILNTADALFLQNGFKIIEDYLTNAVKQYQAQMENVNFGAEKEAADKINRKSEIHSTLSSFYKNIKTNDEGPVILNIADCLFLQNGFQVKKDYQDYAIKQYQAQIENVNFEVGNEAVDKVNHWVSEKTRNRIPKIANTFPKDTQAVITTTLYFNASWAYPFEEVDTHKEKFWTGENEVDVQMMHLRERLPYVRNYHLDFESIDLPYSRSDYALNIILPYPNQTIKNLIPKLKDISVKQIMENSSYKGVDVKLPKTKFSVGKSLVKTFQQLGVHDLFTGANLNDLTNKSIQISEIFHKAEIEIREEGTVATAATYALILIVSENEVDVQMMHLRKHSPYVRNYHLDSESISDYALNIILPYPNQTIINLIQKLKDISDKQIMENYNYEVVNVKLPKRKFSVGANLNDLTDATVLVSKIFHKAEIEIQEKGTIATAATYL
ncbi:hypothetical protein V9T40_005787 [Parthenolecanium corni]|uniref:Serpin domain-containing protein n=1 Tax=Parthenolecanium corni TaxID=536013 RepID=A0AAN9TUT2_9HEMI